jgi:hypothetical protein
MIGCVMCDGGPLVSLGKLGKAEWARCSRCGWDQQVEAFEREESEAEEPEFLSIGSEAELMERGGCCL